VLTEKGVVIMSTIIESTVCSIFRNYPVKRAALFGSAARGDMNENSDVDILVEFLPDTRGLVFFGLRVDLEEALGRSVDLITFNALTKAKPGFKKLVEQETRLIYEYQDT
jgi:predicted nucleotidyltransferase